MLKNTHLAIMAPPLYDLNSPPSPFPLVDLNEQSQHLQLFLSLHQHTASASPSSTDLKVNYYVTGGVGSSNHLNKFQYPVHNGEEHNSLSNTNNAIRVCSDCNTSTTPLWRSGPRGPKSLCNACGIRQRKARRALEAAASGADVVAGATSLKIKVHGNKEMKKSGTVYKKQLKKRKELCFKEFGLSLSQKSGLRRVFPRDVEDAAILLMELSCGFMHC